MFRHVVLLKWTPEATREQRQAAREGEAPGPVPSFAPAGVVR